MKYEFSPALETNVFFFQNQIYRIAKRTIPSTPAKVQVPSDEQFFPVSPLCPVDDSTKSFLNCG